MTASGQASFRPLESIKVIALEQAVSMPYCTFIMGELGAEIIKIERPGNGDVIRGWDDAAKGISTGLVWVNSNKRSLAIDVRTDVGKEIIRKLVKEADCFVENLAPGAVGRLGLDQEILMELNPELIYCSLSGFGADGPYGGAKSYDLTVQGESGILLSNGYPGMPAKVGLPITDLIAGSNAAIGVQAALMQRMKTGEGRFLDVTMLDSALLWLGYFPHRAWHQGAEPPMSGMRHQFICPYGPYLASDDKYVSLAVANENQWTVFCEDVVGKPEWVDDPRIATIALRRDNRDFAEGLVEAAFAEHPRDYWIEKLKASGIPYGVVRTMNEVVHHPQALHRDMFVDADSEVGPLPMIRFPIADIDMKRAIPAVGQHTDEILGEIGIDPATLSELRASKAVSGG
ncbi:MAG: Acetyl-CoA:oxalate CoA-transferase [Verrucomicrobia subdivision 3 bacterium]|nr:Acetyl-CoA:oxalate CoA-transferase [Limisphaerales bacterium]